MRFLYLFLLASGLLLQTDTSLAQGKYYLLYLKDKGNQQPIPSSATVHLSPRAIQKHQQRGIAFSFSDLPVCPDYLQSFTQAGIPVKLASRWLNLAEVVTVLSPEEILSRFPFVQSVAALPQTTGSLVSTNKFNQSNGPLTTSFGAANTQNNQINLSCLHSQGFTGTGSLIAVFDTGFPGVDTIPAYDSIRARNGFVATRNFVNPAATAYSAHFHGSLVFSTMAANLPGVFVGTAPGASYALAVTENVNSETHQEELNWLAAAEWADSLGADIIQSSLSYKMFDAGQGDYTDAQLDGKTAIITKAASMAASKGIIVVNSAGNDGNVQPPMSNKISFPNDADSILTVGSVDANGNYHALSSVGPTADGRTKPDVTAMGANTACISNTGNITSTSGTSLSTPLISGLVACLMQANPQKNWWQVRRAVLASSSQVNAPDKFLGYGIPNACRADSLLKTFTSIPKTKSTLTSGFKLYPVPATENLVLEQTTTNKKITSLQVLDVTGNSINTIQPANQSLMSIPVISLSPGFYFIRIETPEGLVHLPFVKK